ncbi:hypothetical protein SDC9_173324 [bioreactor metagenome]|uniref:Uncharacterized protein n=1 Tax=bioreactor metagenome TaxID=1076179 RepID=A0A645GQF6_9ZZZZ
MIKTEGLMHLKELPQRGRQFFFILIPIFCTKNINKKSKMNEPFGVGIRIC